MEDKKPAWVELAESDAVHRFPQLKRQSNYFGKINLFNAEFKRLTDKMTLACKPEWPEPLDTVTFRRGYAYGSRPDPLSAMDDYTKERLAARTADMIFPNNDESWALPLPTQIPYKPLVDVFDPASCLDGTALTRIRLADNDIKIEYIPPRSIDEMWDDHKTEMMKKKASAFVLREMKLEQERLFAAAMIGIRPPPIFISKEQLDKDRRLRDLRIGLHSITVFNPGRVQSINECDISPGKMLIIDDPYPKNPPARAEMEKFSKLYSDLMANRVMSSADAAIKMDVNVDPAAEEDEPTLWAYLTMPTDEDNEEDAFLKATREALEKKNLNIGNIAPPPMKKGEWKPDVPKDNVMEITKKMF